MGIQLGAFCIFLLTFRVMYVIIIFVSEIHQISHIHKELKDLLDKLISLWYTLYRG